MASTPVGSGIDSSSKLQRSALLQDHLPGQREHSAGIDILGKQKLETRCKLAIPRANRLHKLEPCSIRIRRQREDLPTRALSNVPNQFPYPVGIYIPPADFPYQQFLPKDATVVQIDIRGEQLVPIISSVSQFIMA